VYQGDAALSNFTRSDLDRVDTLRLYRRLDTAADFLLNAYGYGRAITRPYSVTITRATRANHI